jgi:thiol-disulfide isomerase/thioredoxin
MRPTLFLPVLCLFSLSITAQDTKNTRFIVKGKITGSRHPVVYLTYGNEGKQIKDSCAIKEGSFYFQGNISEPTIGLLRGNNKFMDDFENPNAVDFFLEPLTQEVAVQYDHFKEMKITGTKTQLEYEELKKQYAAIDRKGDSLVAKFNAVVRNFIIKYPDSYVSSFELALNRGRWPIDSVKASYARLAPAIQNSVNGKAVKATIEEADRTAVGTVAGAFETVDINGKKVKLSDFKGKYVLLDFWGSWCVPCRESTPHLIEVFNKYKAKGLDVIAIAEEYDTTHIAWREAIKKDRSDIWYNVLSGYRTEKDIAKLYGVHTFPTKILIDKTGVIVGRYKGNGDGPAMDKKLSELFD